ncbi:MAG: FN3 associated domain-containing protein [Verrucomicrobiota bacterium]
MSTDNVTFSSSVSISQSGGTATGTVHTRIAATAPVGPVSGNITLSSAGATDKTVALSGTVTSAAAPLVEVDPSSLTGFSTSAGVVSAAQTFNAEGTNLTGNITITAPAGFEVATTGGYGPTVVLTPSSGTVSSTAVSVRISTAATAGPVSGNVTVASSGATTVNVAVSGTVSAAVTVNYVSLTAPATSYIQDFNGLGSTNIAGAFSATIGLQTNLSTVTNSTLNGWYGVKANGTGSGAVAITADAGTGNSGGMYSYGAASASDRALGALGSASNAMAFGALIKNDGATPLTGLTFSFTAEFWRSSTSVQNILKFGYGKINGTTFTNSNFLTATGATDFTSLDLNGPAIAPAAAALDGNLPANQNAIVSVTFPISLAAGEVAFIRWTDKDDGGSDAGISIDDLTISGSDNPVLMPIVSAASGPYYSNLTVFVSNSESYTAGEILRYTLDGSDPISTSTTYTSAGIPIAIGTGNKTLKVTAFPTSGSPGPTSVNTYLLPLDVANLTALRASPTGTTIYRVLGEVTFTASVPAIVTNHRFTKFFQDSGAGIQIDDFSHVVTSDYTVGDNVANIIGSISTFNGQLQFVPRVNFGTAISSGNPVVPLSRTLATLTDADQARLVSVTDVSFQSAGSAFAAAISFTNIKDPSIAGFTGAFQNLFGTLDGSTIPAGPNTVTGVIQKKVILAAETLTLAARNSADIVYTGPPLLTASTTKSTLLEGGTGFAEESALTITRTGSTAASLDVQLTESTAGALLVDSTESLVYSALPQTLTIPVGQNSATIYVVAAENSFYIGSATLTAAADGFVTANQLYTITENDANTNTYANWIAGYDVDAETGPNDDFDNDGINNLLENYMGSDPSVGNTGLTAVSGTASSLTFRHNRADTPATDITAGYEWSVDLVNWFPSGAGAGITVTIATPAVIINGSPNDLVQVTATVTSGTATKLFGRLKGVKAP